MKGRWLFAAVLAGCGFTAGYMAVKTEDQGRWLFVVFALFFLVLAFAGFQPARPPASQPAPPARTGFAPHWMKSMIFLQFQKRILAATFVAASFWAVAPDLAAQNSPAPAASSPNLSGLHDFDFMFGDWKVHHHAFKVALNAWVDFEGTSSTRPIMGGAGNLEDNVLAAPSGTYRAAAVRAYDQATGQWAIWWVDGRTPHGPLDPPVKGGFEHGEGNFYSDDIINGQPRRTRYLWSHITPTSARWEQAFSSDGGKTWLTNWTMDFTRVK